MLGRNDENAIVAVFTADHLITPADEFRKIVEKGYVIIGNPDEVAEQLREVAVNLNVGQMMLLMQYGDMDKQLTRYNTELFAKRVTPQIRSLFDDDWENRWWPKPLPMEQRSHPEELRR